MTFGLSLANTDSGITLSGPMVKLKLLYLDRLKNGITMPLPMSIFMSWSLIRESPPNATVYISTALTWVLHPQMFAIAPTRCEGERSSISTCSMRTLLNMPPWISAWGASSF